MERRKALAVAASLAFCVVTASAAMAANVGLLKSNGNDGPVGQLDVRNVAQLTRTLPTEPPAATSPSTDPITQESDVSPAAGTDSQGGPEPVETPAVPEVSVPEPPRSSADRAPETAPIDKDALFPHTVPKEPENGQPDLPTTKPAPVTTSAPVTTTSTIRHTTTTESRDGGLDD